jgi:anti-sigma factor RsiW
VTELLPPGVHPQALLLPWYLSGTLAESEQQDVTAHLAGCAACRAELAALTRDRHLVREALSASPGPSRDLRMEVLSRISGASPGGRPAAPQTAVSRHAWGTRPVWLAGMALAASLIIVQFAAILRLAQVPTVQPPVLTRGLGSPTTRLELLVDPGATEAALTAFLRSLHARIVDGPSADGAYVVELATADPGQIAADLARARAESQLIREVKVLRSEPVSDLGRLSGSAA